MATINAVGVDNWSASIRKESYHLPKISVISVWSKLLQN